VIQGLGKQRVVDPRAKELLVTVPPPLARRKDTYSKASSRRLILSHPSAAGTAGSGCRNIGSAESH